MSKVNHIIVNIGEQRLYCMDSHNQVMMSYPVSTSSYGPGNQNGSFKTPLGEHSIAQKIGDGCPVNEVFIGRQPQGVLDDIKSSDKVLSDDIITSRILRLQGEEPGVNQGADIDSYQRYIYIHGTPEEGKIGQPASHGCVRMRNQDVIDLYEQVDVHCRVLIQE